MSALRLDASLQSGRSADARPDGLHAAVFHIWAEAPTYHRLKPHTMPGFARRTGCGREVGLGVPLLPLKHVRAFGTPCKSCWPA